MFSFYVGDNIVKQQANYAEYLRAIAHERKLEAQLAEARDMIRDLSYALVVGAWDSKAKAAYDRATEWLLRE